MAPKKYFQGEWYTTPAKNPDSSARAGEANIYVVNPRGEGIELFSYIEKNLAEALCQSHNMTVQSYARRRQRDERFFVGLDTLLETHKDAVGGAEALQAFDVQFT